MNKTTAKTERPNDRAAQLKLQLKRLEQKQKDETIALGRPQFGTLAKYNRILACLYLLNEDPGMAEKYATAAFGQLKSFYGKAVHIQNRDQKDRAFKVISEEHYKLLRLFADVKLSFSARVDLNLLQDTHAALIAVSVEQLIKSADYLWIEIMEALNTKVKSGFIDITDGDNIIRFIEGNLIDHVTLSADQFRSLQWLCIKLYHALVRRERRQAIADTDVATRLAQYRIGSAARLKELGDIKNAIEDLAEGHLFEIFATTKYSDWKKRTGDYFKELHKLSQRRIIKPWIIASFYAKAYVKGFNLAKKMKNKVNHITSAMIYADEGALTYADYIRPYYFITDLIMQMQNLRTIDEVIHYVETKQGKQVEELIAGQDEDRISTIALYKALGEAMRGSSKTGILTIDSVCHLRDAGIIQQDKEIMDLLVKIVSVQPGSIGGEIMYDQPEVIDNKDATELEEILANQEGSEVEVKLQGDSQMDKISQTVCAFANTVGGKIIIGLMEKGLFAQRYPNASLSSYTVIGREFIVFGFKGSDRFRQNLAQQLKKKASLQGRDIPDIYDVSMLNIGNKPVMILDVKPVFKLYGTIVTFDSEVYARYDNQTAIMGKEELVHKLTRVVG